MRALSSHRFAKWHMEYTPSDLKLVCRALHLLCKIFKTNRCWAKGRLWGIVGWGLGEVVRWEGVCNGAWGQLYRGWVHRGRDLGIS